MSDQERKKKAKTEKLEVFQGIVPHAEVETDVEEEEEEEEEAEEEAVKNTDEVKMLIV